MIATNPPTALRDVLYAFSLAKPVPDARLLDEFVRRYPEHAAEITDFAIELAIDAARGNDDNTEDAEPAVSPAVAVDLYAELRAQPGNLFFSPESISTAFAMAYAGARGQTASEMAAVFHFTLPPDRLHPAMGALLAAMNPSTLPTN